MKVGTLVMLVGGDNTPDLKNGSCGEVKDPTPFLDVLIDDEVAVEFPLTPSATTSGWWKVKASWLIKIGGPDVDVEEHDDVLLHKDITEKV